MNIEQELRQAIRDELKDLKIDVKDIRKDMSAVKTEMTTLKVKVAGAAALIASIIGSSATLFVQKILGVKL